MSALVRRIDAVTLLRRDAVEVTAEGFRLYDALFARTGLQEYSDGRGGTIIEYRPDSEVFSPEALASYELRPLTDLHPPSNLTTETASVLARGACSPGRIHEDGLHVAGRIAVWGDMKIDQLSAGYTLDLDETPGELADGRRYDAVQRNIRINHVAAVPIGRAGTARVLTDTADMVGAWQLSAAKRFDDVPRKISRVIVDMGRWSRRDAADLRTQRTPDKDQQTMKITFQFDGASVDLEVADKATPQQIADATAKATQALADAKATKAADMFETAEEKKKKAEEEEAAKKKGDSAPTANLDAAAFDAKLEAARAQDRADARDHADALSVGRVVLGLGYAGHDDAAAIQRDVVRSVLGDAALIKVDAQREADRPGALRYAFAQARDAHLAKPTHADSLTDEINRARVAREKRDAGGDAGGDEIAKIRRDTAARAALPAHLRTTATA